MHFVFDVWKAKRDDSGAHSRHCNSDYNRPIKPLSVNVNADYMRITPFVFRVTLPLSASFWQCRVGSVQKGPGSGSEYLSEAHASPTLPTPPVPIMKITVKTLQQKQFQVDAEPEDSVGTLKSKIAESQGHAVENQKLIYSGTPLTIDARSNCSRRVI